MQKRHLGSIGKKRDIGMYLRRHIEDVIRQSADTFSAVVITGPRQVGKTTMLQHLYSQASYVTLDRFDVLESAQDNPEEFLDAQKEPVIIDEVQYVPDLFRYVKISSDSQRGKKGRFFLTGSQRYAMMQGVDESLAGRAGIVEMLGLSFREVQQDCFALPFWPTREYIKERERSFKELPESVDIWEYIHKGDLPELHVDRELSISLYYESYIEAYLRRDVRDLAHVGDLSKFNRFLTIVAYSHGSILNKSDLADKAGISFPTAERWLSILEASNIIYFLKPLSVNTKKRIVKSPKLYFLNSALAAHLSGMSSAGQIAKSKEAGAYFEGYVLSEIIKSHLNAKGRFPDIYYYRDSDKNEIDLVLIDGFDLYPIEVKKSQRPNKSDFGSFRYLDAFTGYHRKGGAVICNSKAPLPFRDENWAIPVTYL